MQAALQATQTYLAALASALAAWSEAAAQAAAARDDRIQAAQRTYAQRLQDLQSQADQAWQDYASALFDAGCAPPASGPFQFVLAGEPKLDAEIARMIAQRDVLALQELVRTGGLAPEVEAAVTAAVERIVAQEAWRLSISTAEKELINKVLSGQVPRSAFMRL
jgi:hypothetical protein